MTFAGFDADAVALLAQLPGWDADEYAAHKEQLSAGVSKPGGALIVAVADALDVDLTVTPRSSVSPLHRDLRFAAVGTPRYKDHLLLTAWEGDDKQTSPILWIRVDADRAGFASGMGFTPDIRERWRDAVGGDAGAELTALLDGLRATCEIDVAGAELKRVPSPYPADHSRADLLRHTSFQVRFAEPLPSSVTDASFSEWCASRLSTLLPIHHWLRQHMSLGV